jgi:hypothetical protein
MIGGAELSLAGELLIEGHLFAALETHHIGFIGNPTETYRA